MGRNTRQMLISITVMLVLGAVLVIGFIGCQYRAPSELEPDAPSPLPF